MHKLGLDIGAKRCGVAISDPNSQVAFAKETLIYQAQDWTMLAQQLRKFITDYAIDLLVIGLPTYPSGAKSSTTIMIEQAALILSTILQTPYVFENENQSTNYAYEILQVANISQKQGKAFKDHLAAQIILQTYLDKKNYSKN